MSFNEGSQDRMIRILIGVPVTLVAGMTALNIPLASATGIVNAIFLILGVEVLLTGAIGWSPLYALFGFSTNGRVGA